MTIKDMTETTRTAAAAEGEKIDAYWGEYPRVLKLLAAYYGGFNVGNMSAHNAIRT